jgi:purine nucleosidase
MIKVILDTDIGTDVDDLLALNFLLNSPEVELLGVTAAYGDTKTRGKLAYQALELAGKEKIPVMMGDSQTLERNRKIFWPGHEGKNADTDTIPDLVLSEQSAVEFVLETIRKHPHEVVLAAVAPLTTIAQAILQDADTMKKVKHIVMMGGVFGYDNPTLSLPVVEHNFRSDPEAAKVVFDSDLPVTLFPLDETLKTPFTRDDINALKKSDHPLSKFIVKELETWMVFINKTFHRDYCHLHDPLAVASIVDPSIITQKVEVSLDIECQGILTGGMAIPNHNRRANVNVVTGIDLSRFYELYMARLDIAKPVPVLEKV